MKEFPSNKKKEKKGREKKERIKVNRKVKEES